MSIVVNDLSARFSEDRTVGIAYIYCNFRRQEEQTVSNLVASLLEQLAAHQSALPESVKALYNKHGNKRTRPSLNEISIALQSVTTIYSRVFVIVDAVDECQASHGYRNKFLSELFNLQRRYGINILATSRHIPDIIDRFKDNVTLEVRANSGDVERYIDG